MAGSAVDPRVEHAIASFAASPRLLQLRGAVQHYAWGGTERIPRLIGEENPAGRPYAELWIGAHPRASAVALLGDGELGLDRLMAAAPEAVLGAEDRARFGDRLPFLLKILDVASMLSIQAHPSREQARAGFARENAAGLPPGDPRRSFVDDNHKPEVHAPLDDFWMLHGFRPLPETRSAFRAIPELRSLLPLAEQGIGALYRRIMTMPQGQVDAILGPLVARLERSAPQARPGRDAPEYWALRAAREYPGDRGIFSFWLLNLLHLGPGMGTFQPAGTLHAYLEGPTVELMANSDNVFRGGLTPKRIASEALLDAVSFDDGRPAVLSARPVSPTERVFDAPADEFQLSRIDVAPGGSHAVEAAHGADCIIALEGAVEAEAVASAGRPLRLAVGGIALAPAGLPYRLHARGGDRAVLYRATVPRPQGGRA